MFTAAGIQRETRSLATAICSGTGNFFGAPVGLIFTVRRELQPGQWAGVGMYMQNVMLLLLLRSHGMDTCAQEAWALWPSVPHEYLDIPDDELVYCGMAVGFADPAARINQFESERAEVREYVTVKRVT